MKVVSKILKVFFAILAVFGGFCTLGVNPDVPNWWALLLLCFALFLLGCFGVYVFNDFERFKSTCFGLITVVYCRHRMKKDPKFYKQILHHMDKPITAKKLYEYGVQSYYDE